jgi:hypothetical protein
VAEAPVDATGAYKEAAAEEVADATGAYKEAAVEEAGVWTLEAIVRELRAVNASGGDSDRFCAPATTGDRDATLLTVATTCPLAPPLVSTGAVAEAIQRGLAKGRKMLPVLLLDFNAVGPVCWLDQLIRFTGPGLMVCLMLMPPAERIGPAPTVVASMLAVT